MKRISCSSTAMVFVALSGFMEKVFHITEGTFHRSEGSFLFINMVNEAQRFNRLEIGL